MAYVLPVVAIVSEVVATMSLRASEGFTRLHFTALVVVGHLVAFTALGFALQRGIPLGVAYGVWVASGVALVALPSWLVIGESLTLVQGAGIALVTAGVLALELGGAHDRPEMPLDNRCC